MVTDVTSQGLVSTPRGRPDGTKQHSVKNSASAISTTGVQTETHVELIQQDIAQEVQTLVLVIATQFRLAL